MKQENNEIMINGQLLTTDEILLVAEGKAKVTISQEQDFIQRLKNSENLLIKSLENGVPVYGVNTGYGKSCHKRVEQEISLLNGANLIKFHGCGTGEPVGKIETRAAMLTRIICFSKGYSGVSYELLEKIAEFLNNDIVPVVPQEGSVGASGDLTPMSYIAATLIGDREVFYKDQQMSALEAMQQADIAPYTFKAKEPLAIMNGTSTMTGIALLAIQQAEQIMNTAIASTALAIHALMGNTHHYHPVIAKAKPHPGQKHIADLILELLDTEKDPDHLASDALETLQDPYSLRCSPQIIGVLYDSLEWIKSWVEIEANSSNDNPIFDTESNEVIMSGNFYGGHIVFAMDALKAAVASVADMCDRQVMLLVNDHVNRGLPHDLVRVEDEHNQYNHGFKAMSISASALTAEALKLTMPAGSFSRSTESHNQDKVSMGTIAARDALTVCSLAEKVNAIHLLAATQACEIRGTQSFREHINSIITKVRTVAKATFEDRPMQSDIESLIELLKTTKLF